MVALPTKSEAAGDAPGFTISITIIYANASLPDIGLVGQGGVDPPTSRENGFTARRSCRFATDPYKRLA